MPEKVKQVVRYWSYLVAKFAVALAILFALVRVINRFWATHSIFGIPSGHVERYLLYLICIGIAYGSGVALCYLAILDQRYRCRVCLRRLRMPVETGSWSKMLQLGRPHIQYICVYGHGKLNIPELHLTGTDVQEWTAHRDYWEELCSVGSSTDTDFR